MANTTQKMVRFRALTNLSLRESDELPAEFKAEGRPEGTHPNVLTFGEEWHFRRSDADIKTLVDKKLIVVLPEAVEPSADEEN